MSLATFTDDELQAEFNRRQLHRPPSHRSKKSRLGDDRPLLRKMSGIETEEKLKAFIERTAGVSHTLYAAFGHEPSHPIEAAP